MNRQRGGNARRRRKARGGVPELQGRRQPAGEGTHGMAGPRESRGAVQQSVSLLPWKERTFNGMDMGKHDPTAQRHATNCSFHSAKIARGSLIDLV